MKLVLARCLPALRNRRKLSQSRVAELVGSSQARVAKMESGVPSVTVDLLLSSVLAIAGSPTAVVLALPSPKKLTPDRLTALALPAIRIHSESVDHEARKLCL